MKVGFGLSLDVKVGILSCGVVSFLVGALRFIAMVFIFSMRGVSRFATKLQF